MAGKDRLTDNSSVWPTPTTEQASDASQSIGIFYGLMGKIEIDTGTPKEPPKSDQEAEARLVDLANDIMAGVVKSHTQIASVVRGLEPYFGSLGGASTEINFAAFRVQHAVLMKQAAFRGKSHKLER